MPLPGLPFPIPLDVLAARCVPLGVAVDGSNLTTYSFASFNFGPPDPNRLIVIIVTPSGTGATTVSSATIGGITATIIEDQENGNHGVAIISAVVPTGISGTVSITLSGAKARCGIYGYAVYGLKSPTASDHKGANSASATTLTVTPSVPKAGVVIAGWIINTTGATTTWVGVIRDTDSDLEAAGSALGAAHFDRVSLEQARTIKATSSAAATTCALACATFN